MEKGSHLPNTMVGSFCALKPEYLGPHRRRHTVHKMQLVWKGFPSTLIRDNIRRRTERILIIRNWG